MIHFNRNTIGVWGNELKHNMVKNDNNFWSSCYVGNFTHVNYNPRIYYWLIISILHSKR